MFFLFFSFFLLHLCTNCQFLFAWRAGGTRDAAPVRQNKPPARRHGDGRLQARERAAEWAFWSSLEAFGCESIGVEDASDGRELGVRAMCVPSGPWGPRPWWRHWRGGCV